MISAGDLRFAFRLLQKAPAFAISVVAVLALGIGATTSVVSALDQTIIRPLPYADPDRLAMLSEDFSAFGMPKNRVSPATFFDWKRQTRTFADLAALRLAGMDLAESGAPEQVMGAAVTANLLPLVGVPPLLGRGLSTEEDAPGRRVVVLGYRLWQRRFGARASIVGQSIVMSSEPYTVIGVMPAGFHFPDARTEFWVPLALQPQQMTARNSHYLRVVGRLRPGSTWAASRDDMNRIARQLGREFPASNDRVGVNVTPLKEEVTADAARALTLLLGAAACVLLIACANIASLVLARASGRRREIAVRLALGASRTRIVRQLLTENVLLAIAGGAAGLLVSHWGLRALVRFVPPALSTSIDLHLDPRAVVFALIITVATALLFGLAPALQAASDQVGENLKSHAGTGTDRGGMRLRRTLVMAEIAIALVLVAGAALLIDTLSHLRALDPGFRAERLLTAELSVPYPKYADAGRRQRFYADVLSRVRALPGVERAGLTSDLPYTARANYQSLKIEHQNGAINVGQTALFRLVSADYLQTMGARLCEGRFLDDHDVDGSVPAVVMNGTLAHAYWPHETALGQRIDTGTGVGAPLWMTIVGVVEDIKEQGIDFGPRPAVYVPFTQTTMSSYQPSEIAVRTSLPPTDLASALQQAVWAIDAEQPVSKIQTMDDIVDTELADRQQMLSLLGAFAVIALLLATVGIYSVLSYLVSERRREIGLRMALGATSSDVIRAVLQQSIVLAAGGILFGLAGAFVTTRWLSALLFNVSPLDPAILFGVSMLIAVVTLLASFVPARRAAAVDPMRVLRTD